MKVGVGRGGPTGGPSIGAPGRELRAPHPHESPARGKLAFASGPGCEYLLAMKAIKFVMILLGTGWLQPAQVNAFSFTDVSAAAGIIHQYDQDPGNFQAIDREYPHFTGGAVAEDFDGDGWVDLFVLRGGLGPNLLYLNQGDGSFVDEAATRGAGQTGRHSAVCGADYDSDGDIDLFISAIEGPHLLLTNDGSGVFTVDPEAIPRRSDKSTSPSWADVDGDGLLDLAIGAWTSGEDGSIHLYRNQGAAGFSLFQIIPLTWAFVPHFADLDGDGNVDLVAVGDFGGTRFYRNDGRGIFLPAGSSDIENGMGVATADLDYDGDLEVFMTSIQHPDPESNAPGTNGNRLLLNNGHGDFLDITTASGVRTGYWGWGAVFADLENDGDEDLFHLNGFSSLLTNLAPFRHTPALLFENEGSLKFTEVGAASGDAAEMGPGRCVVSFDYDNDGDLDLFIVNNTDFQAGENPNQVTVFPGDLVLLRNDSEATGHWLKVRVEGHPPHHAHGMGARIYAGLPGKTQMREINASSNYGGHGPYRIAHFGGGAAAQFEMVSVQFPNGDTVRLENVPLNQELVVASSRVLPSRREVQIDEPVDFEMPSEAIPEGGEVVWEFGGAEQANPATFSFPEAGAQTVTAQLYRDFTRTDLWRTETFQIKVLQPDNQEQSIARIWNEAALNAIRIDFPNPAVHARNLFHLSAAMWDAWAAYEPVAVGYLHRETAEAEDLVAARREAISYAAYRLLSSRHLRSVNASASQLLLDFLMEDLGYPVDFTSLAGNSPAAMGNRIAATYLAWSQDDGSLENHNYHDREYRPANQPLDLSQSGTNLRDPNRWQPLRFEVALSQNGLFSLPTQVYAGSQWGDVRPFALQRDHPPYLDPGMPPQWDGPDSAAYLEQTLEVIRFSSLLDPETSETIDISPRARGLNSLGQNDGTGHGLAPNPATGQPYQAQWVKEADYGRVIAEYWADGPDSETPPGHWNTLANKVSDHPDLARRFKGEGAEMDLLEWEVKLYFALNAALHDAAVAAWDCKAFYDYVRPISSIRYLSGLGQLPEIPGLVETITAESSAPGGRHAHLTAAGAAAGDTAILVWGGEPADPESQSTGNRWILGTDWLPYQRATFVTPAFAGYVSGHSTFSRAAAEVLAEFTGDPYFPGGLMEYPVPVGSLEFEAGPSREFTLQWATYFDAADEAGLSRLYGGIHFPIDDGPGRIMGSQAGRQAMKLAEAYFDGSILRKPVIARLVTDAEGSRIEAHLVRGLSYQIERSLDLQSWQLERPLPLSPDDELVAPIITDSDFGFYRLIRKETP